MSKKKQSLPLSTARTRERELFAERLAESHFASVALGSREIYGLRPSWGAVGERLQMYGLPRVIELLGRISYLLDRFSDLEDRERGQRLVLRGLLGPDFYRAEYGLKRYLQTRTDRGLSTPWVLFHERQLLNLAKVAFLTLPVRIDVESHEDLQPFFETLLMINSLLEQGPDALTAPATDPEVTDRAWELFLFANMHSSARGVALHDITRGYLLYHTSRPHLQHNDGYVDLPEKLEEITGIPSRTLWNILKAITAYWSSAFEKTPDRPYVLHPFKYLVGTGCCTSEELTRFLQLYAVDAESLKQEIEGRYSYSDLRPYDNLPFARRPLIMFGEYALIPSIHLLHEKLVIGTHHLFLDHSLVPDQERAKYLTFLGHTFEDYVKELLARTYTSAIGRFVPEAELEHAIQGLRCDGIIHIGDIAILVEAKARFFPLATREGSDWKAYESKLRNVFVGASAQLENTFQQIRAGRLRSIGIDPAAIRTYVPLIVTLETSASNHFLHRRVMKMVTEEGLLQNPLVLPVQMMDIRELEVWETAVGLGKSMHRLLAQKASSPDTASMTFSNYMVTRGVHVGNRKNPFLAHTYTTLTEGAIADFRKRQMGGAS